MKLSASFALFALLSFLAAARAQVVLRVDFNDRTETLAATPMAGFDTFVIDSVGSATAIQTAPTVRTIGAHTVTLAGVGATTGYDDRQRTTPVNAGLFTQELLLRDLVFSRDVGGGGLDVTIDGLIAEQEYRVTIWSFDALTTGGRTSDWTANGVLVRDNYYFNGTAAPATDADYQFNFNATASPAGQILIQGRRDASNPAGGFAVFINALQIEIGITDPPSIAVPPAGSTVYVGDNAILSVGAGGTSPFWYQWYKDGGEVTDATNAVLTLFNMQPGDAGSYTVVITNGAASDNSITSSPVAVAVLPVADIASGLLAHWSLNAFDPGDEFIADGTANANHLALSVMDVSSIDFGRHANSVLFNGTDDFLPRTNDFASLPAYQYPAYTVALWVKGNGIGQSDRRVWAESSNTNSTPIVDIGTVPGGTNGTVDIFIRNTSGGGGINHRQTSLIAFDGSWHHVAWVDNNGYGRVYVDGVQDTNDFTYARGVLVADATCLGCVARTNGGLDTTLFTGNLDDVHIWRRALTEAEVRTVMERVRILSINPGSPNTVINYLTSTPAAMHRVQEKTNIEDAWSDTAGVVIASTGPNAFSATFPSAGGGQKFHRVVSP